MLKYDLTQQWIGGECEALGGKFNYLRHHNRIPLDKFCYKIRSISPKHKDFLPYWKNEIRRIFEGHWVDHQVVNEAGELQTIWKWLPPWTHFHVNHWTIELTVNTPGGKQKVWDRPALHDLEFIRGYVYGAAKGFSGFADDDEYTCFEGLAGGLDTLSTQIHKLNQAQINALRRKDGTWKKYKAALPYLYEEKAANLGKPLFMNRSKNVIDLEARGSGKTYQASGNAGWGWVTDGMTDYDAFCKLRNDGTPATCQQMFISYDISYCEVLLRAWNKGLESMPGGGLFEGYEKPKKSPLHKRWKGGNISDVGAIIQRYERAMGKGKKRRGTRARRREGGNGNTLHVRSCFGDSTAGNGPRCIFIFVEEVGFNEILRDLVGQLIASASDDNVQYGVIWMSGTGGDTKGIATQEVRMFMENPKDYNCLRFANVMENINQEIGMFIPGHLMMRGDGIKDEFGNTNFVLAEMEVARQYAEADAAKDPQALLKLKTRLPRTYNDALLSLTGTKFPTAQLTDVLTNVLVNPSAYNRARPGLMELIDGHPQRIEFVNKEHLPEERKALCNPIEDYPIKFTANMHGCWMILEDFDPRVPPEYYSAGLDPYNQDEIKKSESVGACYIIRRAFGTLYPHDRVVAWLIGRPKSYDDFYEQARRGCRLYRARCLSEAETTLVRDHFARYDSLDLMAEPPPLLRANILNTPVRSFGQTMPEPVKRDLVALANRWLIEQVQLVTEQHAVLADPSRLKLYKPADLKQLADKALESEGNKVVESMKGFAEQLLNLHFLCDPGLLRELIAYSVDGNYDRVIAFMLALAQMYQERGNVEMRQAHSGVAQNLEVLKSRKTSSRRQSRRHINNLPEFLIG